MINFFLFLTLFFQNFNIFNHFEQKALLHLPLKTYSALKVLFAQTVHFAWKLQFTPEVHYALKTQILLNLIFAKKKCHYAKDILICKYAFWARILHCPKGHIAPEVYFALKANCVQKLKRILYNKEYFELVMHRA